jgi:hypothetical protein
MDLNLREPAPAGQPAPEPPEDYLQLFFPNPPDETYQHWTEGCNSSPPTSDTQSRWWSQIQRFHSGESPEGTRRRCRCRAAGAPGAPPTTRTPGARGARGPRERRGRRRDGRGDDGERALRRAAVVALVALLDLAAGVGAADQPIGTGGNGRRHGDGSRALGRLAGGERLDGAPPGHGAIALALPRILGREVRRLRRRRLPLAQRCGPCRSLVRCRPAAVVMGCAEIRVSVRFARWAAAATRSPPNSHEQRHDHPCRLIPRLLPAEAPFRRGS